VKQNEADNMFSLSILIENFGYTQVTTSTTYIINDKTTYIRYIITRDSLEMIHWCVHGSVPWKHNGSTLIKLKKTKSQVKHPVKNNRGKQNESNITFLIRYKL
jgi:hypothetical protein